MKAVLLRTGSVPVQSPVLSGSPKLRSQISRQDSLTSLQSPLSPRISLHLDHTTGSRRNTPIWRVMSSTDIIRSVAKLSRAGSAARISEEEEEGEKHKWFGLAGAWPRNGINAVEELGSSGDGFGKGKRSGGGGSGGNDDGAPSGGDVRKIGEYYKQMLKSNPGDALLLRNYGKYLHEVEGDVEGAEEYYGRAILASPGDGEVSSLYGKLIWESKGDWERAKTYFDQAVLASPRDCSVLGSYASFMWESEEEEEEEIMIGKKSTEMQPSVAAMETQRLSYNSNMIGLCSTRCIQRKRDFLVIV